MLENLEESHILQEYHQILYKIFGIPIDYINRDGKLFAHTKTCNPLCALIRETPCGNARCSNADLASLRVAKATRCQQIYLCHAGLVDIMVPLFIRDTYVGALCTGQIFDAPPTREGFDEFLNSNPYLLEQFTRAEIEERYFQTRYLAPGQIDGISRLLHLVSNYIVTSEARLSFLDNINERRATKAARDYIELHSHEELSVNAVARKVNLSVSHFTHIFKRDTGLPPVTYINRCRIRRAMELLGNTERSISDIAFDCGFQNLTHFNRVFRQFNQETPREYRKKQNM